MSWQAYVDTSLVGTHNVDKAAIFGINGLGKWAGSPDFEISKPELDEVAKAYADKNEPKAVQSNGLHIAGQRYVVIKADDRSLYGMKGKEGVIIVKSKQAILVAHYPATVQANQASTVVENLADYLIKSEY